MTKEEAAADLVRLFPEKADALDQHYATYNELLAHVFFGDEIDIPLTELLRRNRDRQAIQTYCSFIEKMYFEGDAAVQNVVDVTILEYLSDEKTVWFNFGSYLSDRFIWEINTVLLPQNGMMAAVPPLPCRTDEGIPHLWKLLFSNRRRR